MELSLDIEVTSLEVVSGYDGPFGGKPEPALVLGAYAVGQGRSALLDRKLAYFHPRGKYPVHVEPVIPTKLGARLDTEVLDFHFVLLFVALEEDGGVDVRRMYGALEHPEDLAVFATSQRDVAPTTLAEVAAWAPEHPHAVDVLVEGTPASSRCKDDSWIGAQLLHVPARPRVRSSLYRLPFRSQDRRNDWTAFVVVRS